MGSIGTSEYLSLAAALPFGKTLPDARYIHTCGLSVLPEEYSELVETAAEVAEAPPGAFNVIKFNLGSPRVSLLSYPSFFDEGFPALSKSWAVDLGQSSSTFRSYKSEANPPVLHRKETLLSPDHPLQGLFQTLTREIERAGLLEDAQNIGRKFAWEAKLERIGLAVRGNELVDGDKAQSEESEEILRYKTALVRYALSSPMQQLWRHGYLDGKHSIFDYGCGRGDDVRSLVEREISASGWDPHFVPDAPKLSADVVNLGFVLNVIEEPDERAAALSGAWALANKVLVVAVILGGRSVYERFRLFRDGVVTRTGTFQKYFSQSELREYVASTLDREPIAITPGILFVFKDDQEEQSFLAERELSRRPSTALPRGIRVPRAPRAPRERKPNKWDVNRDLIQDFWDRCLDLGRLPQVDEFDRSSEMREKLGSPKTVYRRCLTDFGEDAILKRQAERMADRLVYLALSLFEQRRSLKNLPESVQRDTKTFWGSYRTASGEAEKLLFSIGSPEVLYEACRGAAERGLGYLANSRAFIFQSSVMHELPSPLRVYLGCAARIYGEFEQVDLVKIHIGSSKVSIMKYDDFEGRAIPLLIERTKIRLGAADYEVYNYGEEFPPTPLYFKGRHLPEGFPRREDQLDFDAKLAEATGLEIVDHGPSSTELSEILDQLGLEVHGFRLRRRARSRKPVEATARGSSAAEVEDEDSLEIARTPLQDGTENRGKLLTDQPEEQRMTILEAAIQVLRDRNQPMQVAEIYESIIKQGLYTFGAKSPRSVLSGTLRNHIKKSTNPQLVETSPGTYTLPHPPAA